MESATEITIQPCTKAHVVVYGKIYAEAFSGEPWNDAWSVDDATVHVSEIMENKQAYGLECVIEGEVVGFVIGTSMLFHYGRTYEINDLAVAPDYQKRGVASRLMKQLVADLEAQNIKTVHLITAIEGILPRMYESFGFKKEQFVMLMSKDL